MTYSINFSNNFIVLLLVFCTWSISGCSGLNFSRPQVVSLQAAKNSPQPAHSGEITWKTSVSGGTAPLTYEYRVRMNQQERIVQSGQDSNWIWKPRNSGNFHIRVRVKDVKGYISTGEWVDFKIDPAINNVHLIAFFPLENLSGVKAPLSKISRNYKKLLEAKGLNFLSDERMEDFMFRHRVRYTGGIGSKLAHALREEGVEAVVITSLESYDESVSPKIALTSRLVLCRDFPEIVWIDGVGITGEDSPGLLGLKRILQMEKLQQKALDKLTGSLQNALAGNSDNVSKSSNKINPRDFYLATDFAPEKHYRIAVVPFLNKYARRNAGFVVPLHFINRLSRYENLQIVEPGLVREQLLKYRLIMQAGPSLAVADVLASETSLAADLILSGYVFDYQDQFGTPKIDFSTRLFSGPKREVVWWSRSYANGDDGVYFFDVGRHQSAHTMLQEMTLSISKLIFEPKKFWPEVSEFEYIDSTHPRE